MSHQKATQHKPLPRHRRLLLKAIRLAIVLKHGQRAERYEERRASRMEVTA